MLHSGLSSSRPFSDTTCGRDEFKLESFQRCSVIPDLLDEASTLHKLEDGTTIRLMHVALDCK
jgi:hypothetical protein